MQALTDRQQWLSMVLFRVEQTHATCPTSESDPKRVEANIEDRIVNQTFLRQCCCAQGSGVTGLVERRAGKRLFDSFEIRFITICGEGIRPQNLLDECGRASHTVILLPILSPSTRHWAPTWFRSWHLAVRRHPQTSKSRSRSSDPDPINNSESSTIRILGAQLLVNIVGFGYGVLPGRASPFPDREMQVMQRLRGKAACADPDYPRRGSEVNSLVAPYFNATRPRSCFTLFNQLGAEPDRAGARHSYLDRPVNAIPVVSPNGFPFEQIFPSRTEIAPYLDAFVTIRADQFRSVVSLKRYSGPATEK